MSADNQTKFSSFILGEKANARAYDKGCVGCQSVAADIMLSFGADIYMIGPKNEKKEVEKKITDLFLNQAQAEALYKELGECLNRNSEEKIKKLLKLDPK